jgi:hypothetical protein
MTEMDVEVDTVRVQAKLFSSFRDQLVRQADLYRAQGKSELVKILQEVLNSG